MCNRAQKLRIIWCCLLLEILVAFTFNGFKKDSAVFFVATLNPLSLPFNYLYNILFGREAMVTVATKAPWITVGMSIAVIVISALGAFIGIRISNELKNREQ